MPYIAVGLSWAVALTITAALGIWVIPMLRRLKFGQTILEIGPRWHKDKQGTPTMGGILFVIGIFAGVVVGFLCLRINLEINLFSFTMQHSYSLWVGMLMAFAFGLIGFLDDYVKVSHKENQGLTEHQKVAFQLVVAVIYVLTLYVLGERSTIAWVPFWGQVNLGIFYFPLLVLGIVYIVNVVNFTDGIDGLCSGVTLVVSIGFFAIATVSPGGSVPTMQVLSAALAGGCMGFLVWNMYPAKVFMGDTGSLFLGGIVVALAFGLQIPVVLLLMGAVYIIEGVTVIIQTLIFKYTRMKTGTGRRFFKMTPIHHHFEMSGWNENKIVVVFSFVQALFCLLAVLAVQNL